MRTTAMLVLAIPSVVGAQLPSGRLAQAAAATVSGFVYDSIGRTPLSGAIVQMVGVSDSLAGNPLGATSDSLGWYVIRNVLPGRYDVGFFHIALDSVGIELRSRVIDVSSDSLRVDLATPSPLTLINALCLPNADSSASGLLLGHVRAASTASFLGGASVTATWTEWRLEAGKLREETRTAEGVTSATGAFVMCNLPDDIALLIRAAHGADSSGFVEFTLPAEAVRHLSLHVGDGRFRAQLRGSIHDSLGRPVPNAQVTVWETGRKGRTNARGAFVLDSLPSGTHILEAIALGYTPIRTIVHLAAERPAAADVMLSKRVTELGKVTVTVTYERSLAEHERRLAEFDRHRTRGIGGHFISPEEIERRPRTSMAKLIQGLPGVLVRCLPAGCEIVMTRAATYLQRGVEGCAPTVYLDGRKSAFSASDIDLMLQSPEILGIEVYARPVERPIEFTDFSNKCGAIVVWTKPNLRAQNSTR